MAYIMRSLSGTAYILDASFGNRISIVNIGSPGRKRKKPSSREERRRKRAFAAPFLFPSAEPSAEPPAEPPA